MAWGLVAGAAITVVGGAIAGSANAKNQKQQMAQQNQYSTEDQERNFERQAWLAQQQRAWQLQDRAYKQQAIGGFSKFWNSAGVTPPNQNDELAKLDNFDPNKLGTLGAVNYGPSSAPAPAQPPGATGPLSQLLPPRATLPRVTQ